MKLRILTPLSVAVEEDGVTAVRAEDESGSFGILQGHTDFLTSLVPSVLAWTRSGGARRYCAVRAGVLTVSQGASVDVATREAVAGDDLDTLEEVVRRTFAEETELLKRENAEAMALQISAVRRIVARLRPEGRSVFQ
jgi:F-type H+-transporting ATPase subunit epsilon